MSGDLDVRDLSVRDLSVLDLDVCESLHLQPLPPVPEATEPETTECLSRVSSESATSTDWSNDSDPDDDYVEMKSISKF